MQAPLPALERFCLVDFRSFWARRRLDGRRRIQKSRGAIFNCPDPVTSLFRKSIENIDQLGELLAPLRFPLADALGDAPLHVELEHREADSIQGGFGGRELLQDLDAESWLLHHPPDPSHLSFDSIQTRDDRLLLRLIQHGRPACSLGGCRNYTPDALE